MALAALGAATTFGVGSAAADPSVSPFAGSWSGTWAHVEDDVAGTFDWTISDSGQLKGRVYGATTGINGTIVGHLRDDGDLNLIGYAPNDVPGIWPIGIPHHGTVEFDGEDTLLVSASATFTGGVSFVGTLERK
jgi:hypothetical protein